MTGWQLSLLDDYIDLRIKIALVDAKVVVMSDDNVDELLRQKDSAWWKLYKEMED